MELDYNNYIQSTSTFDSDQTKYHKSIFKLMLNDSFLYIISHCQITSFIR